MLDYYNKLDAALSYLHPISFALPALHAGFGEIVL